MDGISGTLHTIMHTFSALEFSMHFLARMLGEEICVANLWTPSVLLNFKNWQM